MLKIKPGLAFDKYITKKSSKMCLFICQVEQRCKVKFPLLFLLEASPSPGGFRRAVHPEQQDMVHSSGVWEDEQEVQLQELEEEHPLQGHPTRKAFQGVYMEFKKKCSFYIFPLAVCVCVCVCVCVFTIVNVINVIKVLMMHWQCIINMNLSMFKTALYLFLSLYQLSYMWT